MMTGDLYYITILCLVGITVCKAQTANSTVHPHQERYEFESFQFQYDGTTGMMIVRQQDRCYIWRLTQSEHDQIHTDNGLRSVEVRVLNEIEDAEYTVVPKSVLHPTLIHSCTYLAKHYYLVHCMFDYNVY